MTQQKTKMADKQGIPSKEGNGLQGMMTPQIQTIALSINHQFSGKLRQLFIDHVFCNFYDQIQSKTGFSFLPTSINRIRLKEEKL